MISNIEIKKSKKMYLRLKKFIVLLKVYYG